MYNLSTIRTAFSGRVGFRSSYNPDVPILTGSGMLSSTSGVYVNDIHPLLSLENIYYTAPSTDDYVYPAWSNVTTYAKDAIVSYSGKNYKSLQAINLNKTPTNTSWWKPLFEEYLEGIYSASVHTLLEKLFMRKKELNATKQQLENLRLTYGTGRINNLNVSNNNFVGFEIVLRRNMNVKMHIHKIGLQFTQAQASLPIYLFHSSQSTYLQKKEVAITKAYGFSWVSLDWDLYYVSDDQVGGSYYIGYFESDLTGQAIVVDKDWSVAPQGCSSCNSSEIRAYNTYSQYARFAPLRVTSGNLNGVNLWDIEDNEYIYNTNYGLNFEMSIECDLTRFIQQNVSLFDNALAHEIGLQLLNQIAYTTRDNEIAKELRAKSNSLLIELNGYEKTVGMIQRHAKSLEALNLDTSQLDPICLACARKTIKYGSM